MLIQLHSLIEPVKDEGKSIVTTMGKFRHLSHCASEEGFFTVVAIDHRSNLLEKLNQHAPQPISDAQFSVFKQQVIHPLLPEATALLIDPAYGIGAGIAQRSISGQKGLIAPVEVTDYGLHPSKRSINFIEGWSVRKIKQVGGDGVKLLLPYHPEAENALEKRAVVKRIVDECQHYDLPFFLEPIAYSLHENRSLDNAELRQIVVEMARLFTMMGADVLKLQFPVDAKQSDDESEWLAACRELDAACDSPWTVLSAGVDYETFARQARIACEAGASGVIVGRAVWAEAVVLQGAERQDFLQSTAKTRMRELAKICREYAIPWFERVAMPDYSVSWYTSYAEDRS